MNYIIYTDAGGDIAKFKNEYDRDICSETLAYEFPDCEFLTRDEVEG
jgi:hypothetical protein